MAGGRSFGAALLLWPARYRHEMERSRHRSRPNRRDHTTQGGAHARLRSTHDHCKLEPNPAVPAAGLWWCPCPQRLHLRGWRATASITYAKQPYAEYTSVETRYTDYYAFITLARPPKPGHPIVTLRLAPVVESQPAPMQRLRQLAEQIELL